MNKNDVASIRKEFKLENTKLKIRDVVSIYVKGETKQIIGTEKEYFDMMDTEKQELYIKNFKKLLTGQLDSKVFELEFSDNKLGQNPTQRALIDTLQSSDFIEQAEEIAHKITDKCDYKSDFMISFLRGEVYKPMKKEKGEDESGMDDEVFSFEFFMGSVNPVTIPKTELKFDFEGKAFIADIPMDVIINLTAPLDGFMFPSWDDNSADVNKVVYYSNKANTPNMEFLSKVLECDIQATAQTEKAQFLEIVQEVAGKEIEPEKIASIYESVNYILTRNEEEESSEIASIGMKDMEKILQASGVENTQGLETAFMKITGTDKHEFKAANIVPNFAGKSIKIENNTVSISVSPQDLKNIKQVKKDGRRYLLIEIEETANLEGFELSTEAI
ncbi:DUF4317 domain-containing protein [Desulfitobacterium metallireducens]|uniref:DUF4317 domain-containing protein n=1 Tax=Desulfitobacterium metallireducens DSM 15288 TaxID=871968 RepID=W0E9T0_9FIRM|nr:DUF4317 domain-containing protein [Desulfitobacterium metallireducens]AHF05984.1 hypothetical protein DESME_02015 [Desulfitobacterium metallireducens DSM 15288]